MFLKNLWPKNNLIRITFIFLTWRLGLLLVELFAIKFIPLAGTNFYGGGFDKYINNPYLFGWANFDGDHYLSISRLGYGLLEQAFFPIYPLLIHILAAPFKNEFIATTISGLMISNLCFLFALFFLYKLLIIDYSEKISMLILLVILTFPTSFYFGAMYSESIFFLMIILSFYFARQKRWLLATMLGILASTTRIFGFLLLPAFLLEIFLQKESLKKSFWVFLIPLGLLGYMGYQWVLVGDPLAFYHLQKLVGPQHQSGLTLLPQVYYRYFNIIFNTSFLNPIYQTVMLEFLVGILFLSLLILGFLQKVRLSYLLFAITGFLLPTFQGSFSSVPRYVIVLFPGFIVLGLLISSQRISKTVYLILSSILLIIESALFLRGYWVS